MARRRAQRSIIVEFVYYIRSEGTWDQLARQVCSSDRATVVAGVRALGGLRFAPTHIVRSQRFLLRCCTGSASAEMVRRDPLNSAPVTVLRSAWVEVRCQWKLLSLVDAVLLCTHDEHERAPVYHNCEKGFAAKGYYAFFLLCVNTNILFPFLVL